MSYLAEITFESVRLFAKYNKCDLNQAACLLLGSDDEVWEEYRSKASVALGYHDC